MTPTRILSSCVALVAVGCAGFPGSTDSRAPVISKRFYSGAIVYTVEPAAQVLVAKMVKLQGHAASLSDGSIDPRADHLTLPLYRDTDLDRNHHITEVEAEAFYHHYVRDFEDHLGPVVYR